MAVGDYNNDGYLDLYLTNFGPNKLYRNNGDGTFSELGKRPAWLTRTGVFLMRSMEPYIGDYDNDGYQDLYVTNFVKFAYDEARPAPSENSPCKMKGVPIACPPENLEAKKGFYTVTIAMELSPMSARLPALSARFAVFSLTLTMTATRTFTSQTMRVRTSITSMMAKGN